ncbi:MAG: hypothetical protein WBV69_04825 [Candidatus Sulfotelmatobacter sp.]
MSISLVCIKQAGRNVHLVLEMLKRLIGAKLSFAEITVDLFLRAD